jgi:PKHD-type hydroxylase
MILEVDLLENGEIDQINQCLENISYVPGKLASGINQTTKRSEVVNQKDVRYKTIYDIITKAITKNILFSSLLAVKKITPPMVVKYNAGSFYDWHVDELQICDTLTHYSMTLFLSDNYEGGELILKENNTDIKYKLSPGKALIYSTGTLHKVSPVAEGTRLVAIFWIESLIKDEFLRNCVFGLGKITNDLCIESAENNDTVKNAKQKLLAYEQIRVNMMRQYGNF